MRMNRTMQRQVIQEELCKLTCHPTADELYSVVRERMPQISLATVYRNLEQLSELGVIGKLEIAGKQRRYDGNSMPHHHMRCRSCGMVVDIMPSAATEQLDSSIKETLIMLGCDSYSIEFKGVCEDCKGHRLITTIN